MPLNRRQLLQNWWLLPVGATAAGFGFMGYYARKVSHKAQAGTAQFEGQLAQQITPLAHLKADWDSLNFSYAGRQCVLLRLPQPTLGGLSVGGQHYAAFDRTCTHLGCMVNVVRDPEVLAFSFNYRPPERTPQLGCPCHFSVFDPLQSGEAVFGKAHRPLARVRLEVRGAALWATGLEKAQVDG